MNDEAVTHRLRRQTAPSLPLTVVIPAKNEERNLPRCLEALKGFAKTLVVDSGSVDATREIAHRYGAGFVTFEWNGRYPKKRNWVLLTRHVKTEWVLFLDADELLTAPAREEIAHAVMAGEHVGYWVNYTNYFLGRRLKGSVPQRKLALFKVGAGLYEHVEEEFWSNLDMEVHEHPIIQGSVGCIRSPLEHNDDRGIDSFVDRHRAYARWEAHRLLLLEQQKGGRDHLTRRQRFKYSKIERWWYPWAYFVYAYFIRCGFRDGAVGFYYAFYKAWYFVSVRLEIAELRAARQTRG